MGTPHVPTDEELDELSVGEGAYQIEEEKSTVPEPTPDVEDRIRKVAEELKAGRLASSVSENGEQKEGGVTVKALTEFSREDKLAFISHILHDNDFTKKYELLGGRLSFTFKAISAEVDSIINEFVYGESKDAGTRKSRYINYLMAASLVSSEIEGKSKRYLIFHRRDAIPMMVRAYEDWLASFSREAYRLLRDCFKDFRGLVNELNRRARDPDFWPTP
jgi:hypothetical protein